MNSQESTATGLDYLLGLDGNIEFQNDDGYWVKMDVARVAVTPERPHGIKYSLTLHVGKKYPYDHKHRHVTDGGVLYEFDTAYQLVSDFYAEVDRVLKEVSQ
ncbi:MAG: hypothetical protein A3F78_13570 [Burkholderiales bacterium RIFCSPLOWO2_12_FULL_61_40]|nr:MAG: hypothetical protein A3F78_13570 [Burkholderiales bacterium RIFCSPLOWO2_12_FULL_61_40]